MSRNMTPSQPREDALCILEREFEAKAETAKSAAASARGLRSARAEFLRQQVYEEALCSVRKVKESC